jgi:hypothetical protein
MNLMIKYGHQIPQKIQEDNVSIKIEVSWMVIVYNVKHKMVFNV